MGQRPTTTTKTHDQKFIDNLISRPPARAGRKPFRQARGYPGANHGIDPTWWTSAPRTWCARCKQAGYEAYIVGGAVRDLLLGLRPQGLRRGHQRHARAGQGLFRRAFIIGKRFRIVHVVLGAGANTK